MVVAFPRIYSSERAFRLADGQMGQLAAWSQPRGLWLLAQLHRHPTDEPHSETDEALAPIYRHGFLSIVVPFGAQFSRTDRPRWRCFTYQEQSGWSPFASERVVVFDDVWLPDR
jgi:hypothetical protein